MDSYVNRNFNIVVFLFIWIIIIYVLIFIKKLRGVVVILDLF